MDFNPFTLNQAKNDIADWREMMPYDAQGRAIDWDWVSLLDLEHGIGFATEEDFVPGAKSDLHYLLRQDYATRNCVEAILAQCSTTFMMDFNRRIHSYALPRALAHANRRLNDEINLLIDRGVAEGRWTVSSEQQGKSTVTVLTPANGYPYPLYDIQDDTAIAQETRDAYRNQQSPTWNSSGYRTNSGFAETSGNTGGQQYPQPDWRNAYLPGRDVDKVMGIDIETTGTDPARSYIIDVGFEFMNMISEKPETGSFRYEQEYYDVGDAYGQGRLGFAVPRRNALHGNPLIQRITGINVRTRGPESGLRLFDEYPDAQSALLQRLKQQPYVAHNATFEHKFFMLNVEGYAESYRAGDITIIDTLPMSKQWDPGSSPDADHPYGNNTLDAYAKRQGALAPDKNERHLGLEDTHIMLVAMKHHLNTLRTYGQGPWGPDGKPGEGGKHCKKRWNTSKYDDDNPDF